MDWGLQGRPPFLSDFEEARFALDLFSPKELGLAGYEAALALGHLATCLRPGDGGPKGRCAMAVEYFQRAAAWVDDLAGLPSNRLVAWRAYALAEAGQVTFAAGDRASGRKRVRAALALLPATEAEGDPEVVRTRARILRGLAKLEEELSSSGPALRYQAEAVDVLERLGQQEGSPDPELAHALWMLGNLQREARRYSEAEGNLRRARAIFESLPEGTPQGYDLFPGFVTKDLTALLLETGRKAEATKLQAATLRERGVMGAAFAGHEAADQLVKLGLRSWELGEGERASEAALAEPSAPEEEGLLAVVNADRGIVVQMLADCQRAAEDGVVGDHGRGQEDFYRCVLVLQRMGELVAEGSYSMHADGSLHFAGFPPEDVTALGDVVRRGEWIGKDGVLTGPPTEPGRESGGQILAHAAHGLVAADPLVDLVVGKVGITQYEAAPLCRQIWQAFRKIVEAARAPRRPLRRCAMPLSVPGHLDFLLGEQAEDVPKCGRFYVTHKDSKTCRRDVCQQAYTPLAPDRLELSLLKRAGDLAKRRWARAGGGEGSGKAWQQALAGAASAKEALIHFGESLK